MASPALSELDSETDRFFAARRNLWPSLIAARDDSPFPELELSRIAAAGLLEVVFPRSILAHHLSGLGLGTASGTWDAFLKLLRCLGYVSLPLARLFEGHANAVHLVQLYGTPQQLSDLAGAVSCGALSGVWNTDHFEHPLQLERLPHHRFRLHGAKAFASGAGHIQHPLVTGEWGEGGRQMVLLPLTDLASRVDRESWKPLGMRQSASYTVDLTGLELSSTALIGAPGDYYREPVFSAGAIRFAAAQLGAAERLLFETRRFLTAQNRHHDPYQLQRLSEMTIQVESGRYWLQSAAAKADAFFSPAADLFASKILLAHTSMTRAAIENICLRIAELVERSIGARGLLEPHPFAHILADLRMYLRQPATDAALLHAGRSLCEVNYPNPEPF